MKKTLLAVAIGLFSVLSLKAENQPVKTYEQDGCTLKQCMKVKLQVVPAEQGFIVTGIFHERAGGTMLKFPVTGIADEDGAVTSLRWVREPGVNDGHADVMMAKDGTSFVAVIYDRQETPHQFIFHLTRTKE